MKKFLGIALMILMLVFTLASCDMVKGMIIKHEVTFSLDGGVAGEGYAESVKIGDGKILSLPTPTREGYNFLGWYSGETQISEGTPVTSDMSLTAKWEIKTFKVAFLDYYGNTISTETVNWGESATAPTVDSVIEKQKFNGWSADFSKVTEDMTVNAIYVDNTYTISYDLGEVGESFTAPCFYGELPKIPETPVVDGYVFFGWYLDAELTDRYFFDYKLDRDITLYAKFYDTTLGEYIVISNVDQLAAIKDQPDAKYLLACDINCHGEQLRPINVFSGELDGNGYKIFDFSISETTSYAAFINTNNGNVKNLSFTDFTYDILTSSSGTKSYAIVCAINNGTIENCHAYDSEMRISYTAGQIEYNLCIGSIVGKNIGHVKACTSKMLMNISSNTYGGVYGGHLGQTRTDIGGVVGQNSDGASIDECINSSTLILNITAKDQTPHWGSSYNYCGGIVGFNYSNVDASINNGDFEVTVKDNGHCYVQIGGAIGFNQGKIHNCYSTGNIDVTSNAIVDILNIGGFVGNNKLVSGYQASINKCFSTGSITVNNTPTKYGYFAGETTGTNKNCYYLDTAAITMKTVVDENETLEAIVPNTEVGEAKTFDELLSADFIENTLNFDRMIWLVVEGELPTLR